MSLDPRRAQLWQAMQLGPRWELRGADAPPSVDPQSEDPVLIENTAIASPELPDLQSSREQQIAAMDWPALDQAVKSCTACGLCKTRTQTVFGVGNRSARWMLVGEAPGAEEDARGEPFVGQAGRLLDNMLASLALNRATDAASGVFIANVLKCRPPGNRNPEPDEVARCDPFLKRQVALVQPTLIVVMGRFAAQSLLNTDATIASLRGRVHRLRTGEREVPVIVTYHPAYLLRNLADKAKAWADLCLALETYRKVAA